MWTNRYLVEHIVQYLDYRSANNLLEAIKMTLDDGFWSSYNKLHYNMNLAQVKEWGVDTISTNENPSCELVISSNRMLATCLGSISTASERYMSFTSSYLYLNTLLDYPEIDVKILINDEPVSPNHAPIYRINKVIFTLMYSTEEIDFSYHLDDGNGMYEDVMAHRYITPRMKQYGMLHWWKREQGLRILPDKYHRLIDVILKGEELHPLIENLITDEASIDEFYHFFPPLYDFEDMDERAMGPLFDVLVHKSYQHAQDKKEYCKNVFTWNEENSRARTVIRAIMQEHGIHHPKRAIPCIRQRLRIEL